MRTRNSSLRMSPGVTSLLLLCVMALSAKAQSSRFPGQLGSMPYSNGVTFRVWAPNATSVGVKGQFNGWATTPLVNEGGGTWSVDINGAQPGQEYKYRINNSSDKRDPRARRVTSSSGNSIIYDTEAFDWGGTSIPEPWRNDLVIYQMHVGTFAGYTPPATFDHAITRLDHVKKLGISAIKLMPVNEFPGGRSWGYNPSDLFAVESDYGSADAMKRFVKACHERGIAVFVDVVHNHYGPTDLDMWRFDGWYQNSLGGIYFYNDGRAHTMWGSTRPDFGRAEVRSFIQDQIMMFVDEFRVGGFRWDSVYNIINTDWGHNQNGEHLLRDVNWELAQNYPYVFRCSEDHAFDYSMNFESQWDVGYRWSLRDLVVTGSDVDRNMYTLKGLLDGWAGHHRIVFSEAHDYIASNHGRSRIPTEIHYADPESIWARKRALLAAGIVMTTPGVPMIFQGQEMHETYAFHDDTALRWNRTNTFAGIVQAYTDLIHCRRNLHGGMQGLKGAGVNVHHVDDVNKVIAYVRWDAGGQSDDVVVVANFAVTKWTNGTYSIPFPSAGTWYRHFNSDDQSYQADFGGIGAAQVEASGSPPAANVNMGMYSLQIFSKTPPSGVGIATFDPPAPDGCNPVTVMFDPSDGPLQGTTNVVAFVGRNGWLDTADVQLFNQGDGTWAATVEVAEATYELNMAFHDAEGTWDTNGGNDWRLAITGCAGLPGLAGVSPPFPQGCVPVEISYRQREGVLTNAANIYVHLGHNNWLSIQTLTMTNTAGDEWITSYTIPEGTWQLDFVFHDGAGTWDNNNWNNWHEYVSGCIPSDGAGLSITNPAFDIYVPYTQVAVNIQGRAARMNGQLDWMNTMTEDSGVLAAVTNWAVLSIPLDLGANLIRVSGTNDAVNPNDGARDSATNMVYRDAGTWGSGQNGGQQLGGGWILSATTNSGHFLAASNTTPNLTIGAYGWGLWANSGGLSEAVRAFADYLRVGDVLTIRFENNWIETGSSIGVGLQNRFGQNMLELLFIGGGTNYVVNDAEEGRATGVQWTDSGVVLVFELISPTTYRLTVNGTEIAGTLATTSEALVRRFRVWNQSAGPGSDYNLYVADVAIAGIPLQSQEYYAERTVHRRYGPHFTFAQGEGNDTWRFMFPVTEIGQVYDIHSNTNLVDGDWIPFAYDRLGDGFPLQIVLTNQHNELFFRSSIRTQ